MTRNEEKKCYRVLRGLTLTSCLQIFKIKPVESALKVTYSPF